MASAVLDRLRAEVTELVESHGQARDIGEFSRYASDPAGFFRDILHCEPWSKQVEMGELVRDNPRTLVLSANGIGKDWTFARLALWWVYACRGFVILTGTTERTVKHVCMRELRRAFAAAPDLPGELFGLELRVDEDTGIVAFTSGDSADRFQGIHHPRLLILATEAQGLSQEIFDAMAACATAPGNRVAVYGNPTRCVGPFYQAAQGRAWRTLSIPATEHPNVVNGTSEIPGAVSREWVEGIRAEYGEASAFYVSRVLARFPTEGSVDSLIKASWLEPAHERWEKGGLRGEAAPTVGLDVARSLDRDESVAAVTQGARLHRLVTWRSRDLVDTAQRAIEVAREAREAWILASASPHELLRLHPPECALHIDAPGVGSGVVDECRRQGRAVTEYWGWVPSIDPERLLNKRADVFWNLRRLLETGVAELPRDEKLREEMLSLEFSLDPKGRIVIGSKDLIRASLGRSPDRLDATTIALFVSAPPPAKRGSEWGNSRWTF